MGTGAEGDYWSERTAQEGSTKQAAQEESSASSEPDELENPLGEEGAELPKGDAQLNHIFREEHHIADTPETRAKILDYTKGNEHYFGMDKGHGHLWYGDKNVTSNQFWVEVRERIVKGAGINRIPREFNAETGLRFDPRANGLWRGNI